MANLDIKTEAIAKGVRAWQIADALGVSESTYMRHLRHEFPVEKKKKIMQIIDQIAGAKHYGQ